MNTKLRCCKDGKCKGDGLRCCKGCGESCDVCQSLQHQCVATKLSSCGFKEDGPRCEPYISAATKEEKEEEKEDKKLVVINTIPL
jgi:hypothetical protein